MRPSRHALNVFGKSRLLGLTNRFTTWFEDRAIFGGGGADACARFGLNVYAHTLMLDGVYVKRADGEGITFLRL